LTSSQKHDEALSYLKQLFVDHLAYIADDPVSGLDTYDTPEMQKALEKVERVGSVLEIDVWSYWEKNHPTEIIRLNEIKNRGIHT